MSMVLSICYAELLLNLAKAEARVDNVTRHALDLLNAVHGDYRTDGIGLYLAYSVGNWRSTGLVCRIRSGTVF